MGKPTEYRITPYEAAAFRARWQVVAGAQRAELRALTVETKLTQLNALARLAKQLNWTDTQGDSEIYERWVRLRSALHD